MKGKEVKANDQSLLKNYLKDDRLLLISNKKEGDSNILFLSQQIQHSLHSQRRASQRAIDSKTLLTVLEYGTPFYLQGLVFYTIQKNNLLNIPLLSMQQKVKDLVVVMSGNGKKIITCYKSKNAMKLIKKKRKRLS